MFLNNSVKKCKLYESYLLLFNISGPFRLKTVEFIFQNYFRFYAENDGEIRFWRWRLVFKLSLTAFDIFTSFRRPYDVMVKYFIARWMCIVYIGNVYVTGRKMYFKKSSNRVFGIDSWFCEKKSQCGEVRNSMW